ncbi:MAG: protein kinase [Chitinispirillales bacterium]|jgi:serine/threonine protein kinase/outer membrane protein assembly factor BamD (BamD/ComL family)|nr:protein kinase [Chitinispirillales bacterium]
MNIPPPESTNDPEETVKGSFRIRNMLTSVNRTILEAGASVGKYHIIQEIGRGGMAVVYKATQLDLKREVALKVMPANITINYRFVERFLSEAHSVAKLNHPNIVNIYEVATESNMYYIAMEYIAGINLYQHLNDNKPKLVDVLEVISKLAEALSYAHGQKIIHRDLKLNNVIMKDPHTPVLIDFGLAKALEESENSGVGGGITRTGEIVGSPAYMAPERLLGDEVDHRSDICSLGIMLYEMLTFKNPYLDQRNLHQTTYNVMEANPIPPKKLIPWLPPEIEAITLKAMAKDPDMRYQTMDELREDIKRYQAGETVLAKPPSLKKRTARFMRKKWAPIVIAAIIAVFTAILGANYYIQRQKIYSHWQLVYTQPLSVSPGEWTLIDRDSIKSGKREDGNRSITLSSPGLSYVRLERRFNRDVLIEFDVRANDRNLFRTGLFLFGDSPENAYRAHINRDGFGASGITFPGSKFLFQDIEAGPVPWQENNRVTVERLQHSITLTINGVQVAKVFDFFPPIGKQHEMVGFFVDGSEATFSNVRVHRRAIPQVPSPTLIADRFRERGDFESAIDEYNGLMVDQSALNLAKDLHINIAECQIRLSRYEEALATLDKSAQLHSSDALKARARYLTGIAHLLAGDTANAEKAFSTVAKHYRSSPVNFSIMASLITQCADIVESGNMADAQECVNTGVAIHPRWASHWAMLHLKLLERLIKSDDIEQAIEKSAKITAMYSENVEIVTRARTIIAGAHLNMGHTTLAAEIYNQTIHTQNITESVWRSWYALGNLYEYDFDYQYAATLYSKIHRESPANTAIHWMAALKCAEQMVGEDRELGKISLFHEIVNGAHPFPLPRMIAAYYLDRITEIEFLSQWDNMYPQDSWSLYFVARKLLLQGNRDEALSVMRVLQRQLPPTSWQSFQVMKILHNPNRWQ